MLSEWDCSKKTASKFILYIFTYAYSCLIYRLAEHLELITKFLPNFGKIHWNIVFFLVLVLKRANHMHHCQTDTEISAGNCEYKFHEYLKSLNNNSVAYEAI